MDYTPRVRFWFIIVPLFIAIITFSVVFFVIASAGSGRIIREIGESFGGIAAWGLGITIAIALINLFIRRYMRVKKLLGRHGNIMKPEHHHFLVFQKKWLIDVHLAVGIIGFLGALMHMYVLWDRRNILLVISMFLFAWLILVGMLLKWGGLGPRTKRYVYFLHSQWITVLALVIVTLLGHALV